jgi:hypothetical protein
MAVPRILPLTMPVGRDWAAGDDRETAGSGHTSRFKTSISEAWLGRLDPLSLRHATSLAVWPLELRCEGGADLEMAQEKGALVESPAPQPAGDFGVALAGVA